MRLAGRVRTEVHYFSDRLKRKLDEVQFARATIVEAPSGYGKTTALRDYLESKAHAGIPVYWFSATEEAPSSGFRRLCLEISKIDDDAGLRLLRIDLPNAVTIGEVCDAIRTIRCRHETYLVVDNYHLLQDALPPSFLLALIEHGGENLHVVVMTQMLTRETRAAAAGRGFLNITASDLRLNAADIERYYALTGVRVSQEKAIQIERYTEGWILAVYLQLCAYSERRPSPLRRASCPSWSALYGTRSLRISKHSFCVYRRLRCSRCGRHAISLGAKPCLRTPRLRSTVRSFVSAGLRAGTRCTASLRDCSLKSAVNVAGFLPESALPGQETGTVTRAGPLRLWTSIGKPGTTNGSCPWTSLR